MGEGSASASSSVWPVSATIHTCLAAGAAVLAGFGLAGCCWLGAEVDAAGGDGAGAGAGLGLGMGVGVGRLRAGFAFVFGTAAGAAGAAAGRTTTMRRGADASVALGC